MVIRMVSLVSIADNMAGVITTPSDLDQRTVIQFLTAKGYRQTNIHQKMLAVDSEKGLLKTTVKDWAQMFREGRQLRNIFPRPGQAQVVTEEVIAKMNAEIRPDRRLCLRSHADEFSVSLGAAQTVLRKKLGIGTFVLSGYQYR